MTSDAAEPTFETLMARVVTTAQRFELVGHHVDAHPGADFDAFVDLNAALLDKRLLTRLYRPATLAGAAAKSGWVEPDLAPFPWQRVTSSRRGVTPRIVVAPRFRRRRARRRHR
jgi:pantothenate kinase